MMSRPTGFGGAHPRESESESAAAPTLGMDSLRAVQHGMVERVVTLQAAADAAEAALNAERATHAQVNAERDRELAEVRAQLATYDDATARRDAELNRQAQQWELATRRVRAETARNSILTFAGLVAAGLLVTLMVGEP